MDPSENEGRRSRRDPLESAISGSRAQASGGRPARAWVLPLAIVAFVGGVFLFTSERRPVVWCQSRLHGVAAEAEFAAPASFAEHADQATVVGSGTVAWVRQPVWNSASGDLWRGSDPETAATLTGDPRVRPCRLQQIGLRLEAIEHGDLPAPPGQVTAFTLVHPERAPGGPLPASLAGTRITVAAEPGRVAYQDGSSRPHLLLRATRVEDAPDRP